MDNVNVKSVIANEVGKTEMTAREVNVLNDNVFIHKNTFKKEQAIARLGEINSVAKQLERSINNIGTQDMPQETVELYEALKITLSVIAQAEARTAVEND